MKYSFFIALSSALIAISAQANDKQTCRDGIGSQGVVEVNHAGEYVVTLTGPIVQEMIQRGLVYIGSFPTLISFHAPLSSGPFGSRIVVSDSYLTRIASWKDSALFIETSGGARGESMEWLLQSCD